MPARPDSMRVTFGGRYRPSEAALDRHTAATATIPPLTAQDIAAFDRALRRLVDGLRAEQADALAVALHAQHGDEVRH